MLRGTRWTFVVDIFDWTFVVVAVCAAASVVRSTTLDPVIRQCSRPTCSEPAEATLSYNHGGRMAWMHELSTERDPHDYDLCSRHAGRISVPAGWRLIDERLLVAG
jgi:uncharacterized protein DUF3499